MPSLSSRMRYMRSEKTIVLNAALCSPHCTAQRHAHNTLSLKTFRLPCLSESLTNKSARHYEYITLNSQISRSENCWHLFSSPTCFEQRRALHLENVKCNTAPNASSSVKEVKMHSTKEKTESESSVRNESLAFNYSPPPPRPASYVPPDERDVSDPSLDYLSSDNPLHKIVKEKRESQKRSLSLSPNISDSLSESMRGSNSEIVLEEGQMLAPSPKPPTRPTVHYIDHHAERLHSTSVHGGHSLLDRHTGIDTGELYFARNDKYSNTDNCNEQVTEEFTTSLTTAKPYVNCENSSHTYNLPNVDDINTTNRNYNSNGNTIENIEKSTTNEKYDSNGVVVDNLEENKVCADKNVQANHVLTFAKTKPEVPEIDAVTFLGLEEEKISWYQPIFDSKSRNYKSNARGTVYGRDDMCESKPLELLMEEQEKITSKTNFANDTASHDSIKLHNNEFERVQGYESSEESTHVQRQREMHNRRMRWQNRLFSYSPEKATQLLSPSPRRVPTTLTHEKTLQDKSNKELRGYAFPPSSELANLRSSDRMQWLYALEATRREKTLLDKVRETYYKLRGKSDDRNEYVVTEVANLTEDTCLWYRHFNIDAIQRRQLRYMFTDNDYGNMKTTFHVMHSYPYAHILHFIIVMLSVWLLYQLQLYFNALEFYDDYLGIDLTMSPALKKPLLGTMAFIVGFFYLYHPTCLLSIGITRAYRILLRRPIGPP